jgi:PHD/YefM family antitoxin component YafN of YafNO toxin-antitoxin module
VQQTVLLAIEEYLSARETAEILANPAALRGLAEAMESEQAGDVVLCRRHLQLQGKALARPA